MNSREGILVSDLNWTNFYKWLPGLVGRCLGLLWLTKEKLKVPDYRTMGGVTGTTHQDQFHREANFYAKTIEGKNPGPDR